MEIILVLIISYLIGSIPFGLVVSKVFKIDIREYGSGNIGATNVLRTLGAVPATVVLLLDLLKGTFAVYLALFILNDPFWMMAAGLVAVLGHTFSIFLGFRGGRGVATGLGVLLGITPDLFIITFLLGILIIGITRYVSVGSITGAIILPILMFTFHKPSIYAFASLLIAILIVIKHIPNIKKLINGTEHKIGEKIP